jgi:predicted metal-dependent hydrolase
MTKRYQSDPQKLLPWPPPYILRHSDRARRMSLKVTEAYGLEIVLPLRASKAAALDFLDQHRSWVLSHSELIVRAQQPLRLPEVIDIVLTGQRFQLLTHFEPGATTVRCQQRPHHLLLVGNTECLSACFQSLTRFLKRFAKTHLRRLLNVQSTRHQLPYNRILVRGQKNIWGSCSSDHDISLNFKLLFFEARIVEYVLIHELCHTVVANHSSKFWQRVASCCVDYQQARRQLKEQTRHLPNWVHRI